MISLSRLKEMVEEEMENKIKDLELVLKAKEQECNRLKLDLIEAKAHGDYLNNLALSETLNLVSEQLDQLKTENKELKEELEELKEENEYNEANAIEFKQTLTEIKEIIHFNKNNRLSGGADISIKQILQKISEVEDET